MAKRKATEDTSAEQTDQQQDDQPQDVQPAVGKTAAVRLALEEGLTDNAEIAAYAKERFGHELTTKQVAIYKSQLKAKEGRKGGARANKRHQADTPAAPAGGFADDLAALRGLVAKYGAEELQRIVRVLGGG